MAAMDDDANERFISRGFSSSVLVGARSARAFHGSTDSRFKLTRCQNLNAKGLLQSEQILIFRDNQLRPAGQRESQERVVIRVAAPLFADECRFIHLRFALNPLSARLRVHFGVLAPDTVGDFGVFGENRQR